jgi:hypothetical protein
MAVCWFVAPCGLHSTALMVQTVRTSETLLNLHQRRENLRSYYVNVRGVVVFGTACPCVATRLCLIAANLAQCNNGGKFLEEEPVVLAQ